MSAWSIALLLLDTDRAQANSLLELWCYEIVLLQTPQVCWRDFLTHDGSFITEVTVKKRQTNRNKEKVSGNRRTIWFLRQFYYWTHVLSRVFSSMILTHIKTHLLLCHMCRLNGLQWKKIEWMEIILQLTPCCVSSGFQVRLSSAAEHHFTEYLPVFIQLSWKYLSAKMCNMSVLLADTGI